MFNRFDELKKYSEALTALFVEDNEEARRFTHELLERLFKSVEAAKNGLEGLVFYNKNYYDIVITDINMFDMNGIQMAEKIREINPEQKIIAVSAHNESHILIELVKAGFNSFALKPIEPHEFFKTLYPVVRDAYTQKINEELMLQLSEEREKLKRQLKELRAHSRTIETKHQQIQELLSIKKTDPDDNNVIDNYFKPDDDIYHDKVLLLSEHKEELMEIFSEIPNLLDLYIQEQNDRFFQDIIDQLRHSISIMLYYTPYIDILAESLSSLVTALQANQDKFRMVCSSNPDGILRLFDAISFDIERYVTRFSKESLAMENIHHIHKPTALSIIQIIQCIAPKDAGCGEIDFF